MIKVHKMDVLARTIQQFLGLSKTITKSTMMDRNMRKHNVPYIPKKGYQKEVFNDVQIFTTETSSSATHLFYIHGGGYVQPPQKIHYLFLQSLIKKIDVQVHFISYPLAPYSTSDHIITTTKESIEQYCQKYGINAFMLMGDSAGGGLALTMAHELQKDEIDITHLVLLSPWLDITMETDTYQPYIKKDSILSMESLKKAASMYTSNPENQQCSPLFYTSLPETKIFVMSGTYDILHSDALRFEQQYPSMTLHIFEKGVHDFMLFPFTKTTKKSLAIITSFLSE